LGRVGCRERARREGDTFEEIAFTLTLPV